MSVSVENTPVDQKRSYYTTDPQKEYFRELTETDVKGAASDRDSEFLRRKENLDAWHEALAALDDFLERMLSTHQKILANKEDKHRQYPADKETENAYLREKERYDSWRDDVLKIKEATLQRLEENKNLKWRGHHSHLTSTDRYRELVGKTYLFLIQKSAVAFRYRRSRDELLDEIERVVSEEGADE